MNHAELIRKQPPPAALRGFGLTVTEFEGPFNDNALKTLVTFIGLGMRARRGCIRPCCL